MNMLNSTNILKLFLVVILISIFKSCSKSATESTGIDLKDLYTTWVHSYEEDSNNEIDTYRPDDYLEFPASRFRMKYVFSPNSTCQWLVLADDDGHYLESGTWEAMGSSELTILIYDSNRILQENISFKISNLEKNLLEIEPNE